MSPVETVPQMLKATAEQHRDRIAAVEGERRIAYGELYSMALSLAAYLRLNGFGKGDKVGLLLPNSVEYAAAFFALAGIGAVSVPLNTSLGEEELGFFIRHSSLQLLLTADAWRGSAESLTRDTGTEVGVIKGERSDWSYSSEDYVPEVEETIEPEDEAVYLYSTGSTGAPKRVARTHYNLIALARNHTETIGWTEEDRILFAIPLSHTYGLGNFLGAVRMGAAMHLLDGFKRGKVVDAIERERITVFPAVPFMLGILGESYFPEPRDFSSLRMVLSAGAPLKGDVFARFREKFGVPPRQLYGSTETGVIAINMSEDPERRFGSVGKPVRNVEVRIVGDDGRERGVGERGEVAVRSPSMTTGYWGLPEETARAFRGGYYFTGDLGRRDEEGYLYLEGRRKLLINVAGNKVDPLEIENLLTSHPRVREAVVLGVEDRRGEEVVKAVVVPEGGEGGEGGRRDLIEFLRGRVAEYKIPRIIEFREELPRSPTGKVLRERLKKAP